MFETKEQLRGYNQSKLLAKEFANKTKVPFVELCAKVVDTTSQTELNTKERIENVKDSFAVKREYAEKIKGKIILIIDDVISTGESLAAVRELIKKAGAIEAATCAFLAEGDAAERTDIIFLEKLPLFFK
jgi:adenine phosphoribosyltransferase